MFVLSMRMFFWAPTGAKGVKMCVRASVCVCDIMLESTLKKFLKVLMGLKERGPLEWA